MKLFCTLAAFFALSLISFGGYSQWVQQCPALQCTGSYGPFYEGEACAFSADGNTMASAYHSTFTNQVVGGVFVFRKANGQWAQQVLLTVNAQVANMALSSNGNTLAMYLDNDSVDIYQFSNNSWRLQWAFLPATPQVYTSYYLYTVGISYNGNTLVIGPDVYVRSGVNWTYLATLRPNDRPTQYSSSCDSTNKFTCDYCRSSISADGNTIVVADSYEPDETTDAWVFVRNGNRWQQQGPRLEPTDNSNVALQSLNMKAAISGDGKTIVVGGVVVFSLINNLWAEQTNGYLINPVNTAGSGYFNINYNGTTIITGLSDTAGFYIWEYTGGAWRNSPAGQFPTSINIYDSLPYVVYSAISVVCIDSSGNHVLLGDSYFRGNMGGTWAFDRNGSNFIQDDGEIYGAGMVSGSESNFCSLALSADGNTMTVGNFLDDGEIGSVSVFTRNGATWTQVGPKLTLPDSIWHPWWFGGSVALSADGSILAVGAPGDTWAWNSEEEGGVFIYKRNGGQYNQLGAKIWQPPYYNLGQTVNLSDDGQTLLTADDEYGGWIYTLQDTVWGLQGFCQLPYFFDGPSNSALSGDGNTAILGCPYAGTYSKGNFNIFTRHNNTWSIPAVQDTDVHPTSLLQYDQFPSSLAISGNGSMLAASLSNATDNVFIYTRVDSILNTSPATLPIAPWDSGYDHSGNVVMSVTGDTVVALFPGTLLPATKGLFNGYRYTGGHWSLMGQAVTNNTIRLSSLLSASADLHFMAAETQNSSGANEIDIFVMGNLIDSLVLNRAATCAQLANGEIIIHLRGGTPPYHYAWSNGGPDTAVAANLLPGNYQLTITDAGADTLVRQYTVTAAHNPVTGNNVFTWNCLLSTGSVSLNVSGGNAPYTYNWGTIPVQHTITATGLSAGSYAYTVTDSLGCLYSDTAIVTPLTYWANATATNAICGTGGSAIATMNTTAPYSYLWSNGQTTDSISAPGGGNFMVSVTDANGCTASASTSVNLYCDNLIQGRVFFDRNNNCVQDAGEPGTANLTMIATNGAYTVYGSTNSLGNYSIQTPVSGNFTVSIAHWQECSYPVCTGGIYPVTVTLAGAPDTLSNVNIPLVNPGIDLTLQAVVPQPYPGSSFNYILYYGNLQDSVIPSGSVSIVYDSLLILNSTTPAYTTLDTVNHIITFNVFNIGLLNSLAYSVTANFTLPANVSPHTVLPMQSFILPDSSDCNPLNNFITLPIYVAGSLDPNSKISCPGNTLQQGDSLITYTIHFQNVGSDSTHFVQVVDTLQPDIDPASVVTISTSSYPYIFSIKGSGILSWLFNPLSLPDSATNPAGSQGYVTFQVKTRQGLSIGTAIQNTASIYFDYNTPVQTNTSNDTVVAGPCNVTYGGPINPEICPGDTFYCGSNGYMQAGTYADTLINAGGCDSIVTINLTVFPTFVATAADTICSGDSVQIGNIIHTVAGYYRDTLTTINGCDSIINLTLTVKPLPVVSLNADSITVHQVSPYPWLYCAGMEPPIRLTGGTPVGGSYYGGYVTHDTLFTLPALTDTIFYSYTDSITGCTSVASNIIFSDICEGVSQLDNTPSLSIYPNPTTGQLIISTQNFNPKTTIICDDAGRLISTQAFKNEIDISSLSSGVYFVEVTGSEGVVRKRVVKM